MDKMQNGESTVDNIRGREARKIKDKSFPGKTPGAGEAARKHVNLTML